MNKPSLSLAGAFLRLIIIVFLGGIAACSTLGHEPKPAAEMPAIFVIDGIASVPSDKNEVTINVRDLRWDSTWSVARKDTLDITRGVPFRGQVVVVEVKKGVPCSIHFLSRRLSTFVMEKIAAIASKPPAERVTLLLKLPSQIKEEAVRTEVPKKEKGGSGGRALS